MSLDITLYMDVDTGGTEPHRLCLFDGNITHNLGKMAREAGIHQTVWYANEYECAGLLIDPLREGLTKMVANPEYYQKFDSSNGWGTYDDFVPWLQSLYDACVANPKAMIHVSK